MLNVTEKEQYDVTKKEYVTPELDIIEFETEDIITASEGNENETEMGG